MSEVIRFLPKYNTDIPSEYHGNPYIEALPELHDLKTFLQTALFLKPFDKSYRLKPAHFRKSKAKDVYGYVVPNQQYYELYQTLWCMLFDTYKDRNSFNVEHVKRQYSLCLLKQKMDEEWAGTTGESLLITAHSGFGKTMMVKRVLQLFPQVLDHEMYNGRAFKQPQVLWIYLKIPSNANRKSLCHLFLEEIDKCVGTTYAIDTKMTTQIGNYEQLFRTVVETYKVGLLAVDELRNLAVARSGGDQEFLNFFSSLSEQWRLGFVLIGTPDIVPTLQKNFTATRRLTSGGDMHFERYKKNDPIWKSFVCALWQYQYVTQPLELYDDRRNITNHKLFDEIYKMTQGVPFVFSFIFVQAQQIAIDDGDKVEFNLAHFRKAYNEKSSLIKAAIEDIRNNNGLNYPDLMSAAIQKISLPKVLFINKLQQALSTGKLSAKHATLLRKDLAEIEEEYVLDKREMAVIKQFKDVNMFMEEGSSGNGAIEGDFKEVI
jgi:Cdc6-like AAA superfamily ATPase